MAGQEGGRWDVSLKDNAICVERISDSDKQVFDDLLAPEEARELAGLLTKFADQLDESKGSDKSEKSDDSDKDQDSEDSDKKSDKSEDSEDSDKSSESDKSSD
jgi:hypothetical protein